MRGTKDTKGTRVNERSEKPRSEADWNAPVRTVRICFLLIKNAGGSLINGIPVDLFSFCVFEVMCVSADRNENVQWSLIRRPLLFLWNAVD